MKIRDSLIIPEEGARLEEKMNVTLGRSMPAACMFRFAPHCYAKYRPGLKKFHFRFIRKYLPTNEAPICDASVQADQNLEFQMNEWIKRVFAHILSRHKYV